MSLRRIARPLIAAPFIRGGCDAVFRPASHVEAARPLADLACAKAGFEPISDTKLSIAVRVHGALTAAVAAGFALGIMPRTAATKLAILTAPLLAAHQPFTTWRTDAPEIREAKLTRTCQIVGQVGAALLAAADTGGKPSLKWRYEQARQAKAAQASVTPSR